ncbi:MAG TPA: phosphoesterase [Planctomycetaceae bacterium]|nr:phosphoesterase [Planctomycetaceae bacterium]
MEEQILVVPTSLFHRLGHFQGFSRDVDTYVRVLLDPKNIAFRSRSTVENDPGFKQLIPYMLFCFTDSAGEVHVFRYVRGKGMGENRLHGKASIGIGGHLSSADLDAEGDVYREGMRRELDEEVRIDSPYKEVCVGMINDDETGVGRVHLGIVHRFDLESPAVVPMETDIIESGFVPVREMLRDLDGYETWSAICLKALFGESPDR